MLLKDILLSLSKSKIHSESSFARDCMNLKIHPLNLFDVNDYFDGNNAPKTEELLVIYMLPKILVLAFHYSKNSKTLAFQDIVSEGVLGAYTAIHGYSKHRNTSFYKYATYHINQSMSNALLESDGYMKNPASPKDVEKLNRVADLFFVEHEYEPSILTLSESLGMSETKIRAIYDSKREWIPAEELYNDDDNDYQLYFPSSDPTDNLITQIDVKKRERLLNNYCHNRYYEKTANIILDYYFEGKRMSELSKIHLCTRERIRQIVSNVTKGRDPNLWSRFANDFIMPVNEATYKRALPPAKGIEAKEKQNETQTNTVNVTGLKAISSRDYERVNNPISQINNGEENRIYTYLVRERKWAAVIRTLRRAGVIYLSYLKDVYPSYAYDFYNRLLKEGYGHEYREGCIRISEGPSMYRNSH